VEGHAGYELNPGIRGADGFYVATVATDCPAAFTDANAHLIAAAPDLLAALRECLNYVQSDYETAHGDYGGAQPTVDRARAAIKKAQP